MTHTKLKEATKHPRVPKEKEQSIKKALLHFNLIKEDQVIV